MDIDIGEKQNFQNISLPITAALLLPGLIIRRGSLPTANHYTSDKWCSIVKHLMLFTVLQSFLGIPELKSASIWLYDKCDMEAGDISMMNAVMMGKFAFPWGNGNWHM